MSVPAGQTSLNAYLVDLLVIFGDPRTEFPRGGIPTYPAESLLVIEYLGSLKHYNGLLGRDILNRGTLKANGPDQHYTLVLPDVEGAVSITDIQHGQKKS